MTEDNIVGDNTCDSGTGMVLHKVVAISKEAEVHQLAQQVGREIFAADNLTEAADIVEAVNPDLILFDSWFTPDHIRQFLNTACKNPNVPIVVVGSDEDDADASADFIRMGAHDYLQGKQDHHRLKQIANRIKNKLKVSTSKESASDFFADDFSASVGMVGASKAHVKTLGMIRLVAASRCNPVLIMGQTGTGKELAAKAVHILRHPNEPFLAVNCAALTANLLESELFGHVKGSFTGADRDKKGLLEAAGAGTILLDEISEMPMDLQAKLLRVLQEKTFRKVGDTKNITCKAAIIASSNHNLYRETKANRFRRDLYYRLNICPIIIASLKSHGRREDIPLLAEYLLKTSTICPEKADKITSITNLAMESLQQHDWPGNVRELHNVIERAILLETTGKISLSNIVIAPAEPDAFCHDARADKIKDFSLAKAERELVARALQETNGQKTKAATLLGISRATLYAKVKQHNIEKYSHIAAEAAKEMQDEIAIPSSFEPISAM